MKLTEKSDIAVYLRLVDNGASVKAYRVIGMTRVDVKENLKYLAEYRAILAGPEPELEVEEEPVSFITDSIRGTSAEVIEEEEEEDDEDTTDAVRVWDTEE